MSGDRPQPSRRVARIASRMKFILSQVIQRELNDPRIGFITVLDVEPTEDVKEARVRVSVLGPPGARSKAEHALQRATGFIQRELGRSLGTRNTPQLRFLFDNQEDKASRIEALIQKASQEDRETTMAKKPSKKPSKQSREEEKPGKKPSRKDGGRTGDEEEDAQGQESSDDDAGSEGDASEDDFASDFDEKGGEDEKDEGEDYDDDFDEDYSDEDEDLDEDIDEEDESEDDEEAEDDYEDEDEGDYDEDR